MMNGQGDAYTDSLEIVLQSDLPILEQAEIHNEISNYLSTVDSTKASHHAFTALDLATSIHSDIEKGKAFKNLALIQGYLEYTLSSISYNDSAMYYFTAAKDTLQMIKILNNVGRKLCFVGRFEEGIKGYQQAEKWLKESDPKRFWLILRLNHASCLEEAEQSSSVVDICLEAIEVCKEIEDKILEIYFINLIANAYTDIPQNQEKALHYFKDGLDKVKILNKPETGMEDDLTLMELKSDLLNNRAVFFLEKKEYEKAYQDLLVSLEILDQYFEGRLLRAENLFNLAIATKGMKLYSKSHQYFEEAFEEMEKSDRTALFPIPYRELAELYALQSDYKNALFYHKKSKEINDSIFSLEVNKNLQELNTKYENEKIKKDLAKKELALEINKNRLNLYKIGGLILCTIIGVGYWFFRNRQKRQQLQTEKRQIELEHGLLRAQMNPHFIFNALNSIQGFFLNNQVVNGNEFMGKFSTLMRRVLDQSSKSKHSLSDELDTLKLYLDIEKTRLEGLLEYEINYSSDLELELIEIPPLIFQPFVENSIWHGIVPKKSKGLISIQLATMDNEEYLWVQIQDNGVGLKDKKNTHKPKGLSITKERLGKDSSIKIFNTEDKDGVTVELKIPIREE